MSRRFQGRVRRRVDGRPRGHPCRGSRLGLSSGARRSQPLNPLGNGPLPPDPVETKKLFDQEIKRLEEQEKSRWAWVAWIFTPGGVLVVMVLIHGVRAWSEHAKAMEKLQDEQKRG
jgi:hypothetical protein